VAEERSTVESTKITRTVGRVTAIDGEWVTVLTPAGKSQQLAFDDDTEVFRCAPGDVEDITDDSRIVVKYHADSPNSAQEVIVLPADSAYGLPIVDRDTEWVTTRRPSGNRTDTYLGYATIKRTRTASVDEHVATGSMLFGFVVRLTGDAAEGEFAAKALIVLSEDTAYGS
jgi:hypothetical protein